MGWVLAVNGRPELSRRRDLLKRFFATIGLLAVSLLLIRWLALLVLTAVDQRNGLTDDFGGQLIQLCIGSITTVVPLLAVYFIHLHFKWGFPYRANAIDIHRLLSGYVCLFFPLLLLFIAAVAVGARNLSGLDPGFDRLNLLWFALTAGKIFLSALFEELVFRGVLLEQLRALLDFPMIAVIISASIFGLAHYNPDADSLIARTIVGIGLGWSAVRLRSIAFPVGAHFGINLGLAVLSPGFGTNPVVVSHAVGSADGSVTGYWQGGLVYCVLIVAASEAIRFRSRRVTFQNATSPDI